MAILSIQSHVSYGYVGNSAATFPLQRLGYDVWGIHTVQFSNHTGYGDWTGQVFESSHIKDVIQGIANRGVLSECHALLTGYMGDASIGEVILEGLEKIKSKNPDVVFCCDPVMGDVGRGFFVRPGILEFMKEKAIQKADIITPNLFEMEALSEAKITSYKDIKTASDKLHKLGPKIILTTSFKSELTSETEIEMFLSTSQGGWTIKTPFLPLKIAPNGAGDAVSALFLGFYLSSHNAITALEEMTSAIYAIFEETLLRKTRELQFIKAQEKLLHPSKIFTAQRIF